MIFKVAILQTRAEISNIKRNIDTIICSMKEASKNGADILLLPECFVTGYELPITYEKSISCDDEAIMKICEAAKECNIGVVLTSFTKGKTQPQNTAFVINKFGEILMKY
ncbi:MAG: carbon-nitrogen hydrolase family protein [Gallibacter sp.]|nr:carbon-nitrogen hydrolase family protein [Gallibacter sp.]